MAYETEHCKAVKEMVRSILVAHGVTDEPTQADVDLIVDFGSERWSEGVAVGQSPGW